MTGIGASNLGAFLPDPMPPNGIVAVYILDLFTSATGVCVATAPSAAARW